MTDPYFVDAAYRSPGGRALANPGVRLGAKIIDALVVLVPLMVLMVLTVGVIIALVSANRADADTQTVVIVLGVVVGILVLVLASTLFSYLYLVVYQVRTGSTIGKRVLGIRAVRLNDGASLDTSSARRRWLASEGVNLLALVPIVGLIATVYAWADALWLLWDRPHQQCLHDKYANTIVVQLTPADLA